MKSAAHEEHAEKQAGHYTRLLAMTVLSFLAMYALMYAMVDVLDNVIPNNNQFYMAGLMTAPMVIFEMALMGRMYPDRKINAAIIAVSAVALVVFWMLIRQQVAISEEQFLKSMIPHHAGAILMCEQSSLQAPDLQQLCREIVVSQRAEIALMKAELRERE